MFWRVCWSNYDQKKRYSCLAVGWNVWGFHELGLFRRVPRSNYNLKKRYRRLAIGSIFGRFHELRLFWRVYRYVFFVGSLIKLQITTGKKVQSSGHWLECLLRTFDSFWMGVIPPARSSLSKSIQKVSITATCRLEWHYQLSKKIIALSLSNIEIQWFFFQVDT